MVVDRPVVHKIPMVRISAKDADRRTCDVKGLDMSISKDMNKSQGHRQCGKVRILVMKSHDTRRRNLAGVSKLTGLQQEPKGIYKDRVIGTRKGTEDHKVQVVEEQ